MDSRDVFVERAHKIKNLYSDDGHILYFIWTCFFLSFQETNDVPWRSAALSAAVGMYTPELLLIIILFIHMLGCAIAVGCSVVRDRRSRMMETLMKRANPLPLLFGKWLGIGIAGCCQFIVIVLLPLLVIKWLKLKGFRVGESIWVGFQALDYSLILYLLIFFILGYLLFSSIYVVIGSVVRSEKSALLHAIIALLLLLAIGSLSFVLANGKNDDLLKISSFIPFLTPFLMIVRVVKGGFTYFQLLISMMIMIGAIWIFCWFTLHIYGISIRGYGRKMSVKQLLLEMRK